MTEAATKRHLPEGCDLRDVRFEGQNQNLTHYATLYGPTNEILLGGHLDYIVEQLKNSDLTQEELHRLYGQIPTHIACRMVFP